MTQRTKFQQLLADQITNEFAASQQYNAIAVYYDNEDMPQLARHFYEQSVEERNHAMMIVQYFLDRDQAVGSPASSPRRTHSATTPNRSSSLWRRRSRSPSRSSTWPVWRATTVITSASSSCSGSLKEQVEEVATMTTLLTIAEAVEGQHLRPGDLRRARDQQQDRH